MPADYVPDAPPVRPYNTYAPWKADGEFWQLYTTVSGARCTVVDEFRAFELWQLVHQLANRPLDAVGDILEVGVWRGGTTAILAAAARRAGLAARVFACDTFEGVVKAGSNDPIYVGGEFRDTSAELASSLFASLGLNNVAVLKGVFPDETGSQLANRRFALCHVDVDVYQSAKEVVEWLWPRLVDGGVVVFDDYGFVECAGVAKFVDSCLRSRSDALTIHNLNGHAVVVKIG
jgi:O-methyltransferase